MRPRGVYIGIPVYCEREWLPRTLTALDNQTDLDFQVWVCVNQPAEYDCDQKKLSITRENRETLDWLYDRRHRFRYPLRILSAVKPPAAPPLKISGVGWARRYIFDSIAAAETDNPLCISLDADTLTDNRYVADIRATFSRYPNAVGLAAPYYHRLPERETDALRILRYEIYLRYYQLSLWRIGSPYAFMPIGSGMAFPLHSYRRIGGIPPRKAGEDFYFLQQLRKTGPIIRWLESRIYPSPRPSIRNPFGTGAVMADTGPELLERRYPFYSQAAFDALEKTFSRFPSIYNQPSGTEDIELPLGEFVQQRLKGYQSFINIRRNCSSQAQFVKACHEKVDALRTLQYLRFYHQNRDPCAVDMENINDLLARLGEAPVSFAPQTVSSIELDRIRNTLLACESRIQREFMQRWDNNARW